MPQNLLSDLTVTLAAGASSTVPHGITGADGVGIVPFEVRPDRSTPIVVTAVDAVNVSFDNPDASAATAIFRAWRYHSVTAPPGTPALRWQGGGGGGGGGGGAQQLLSTYFLDASQAADATVRRYDDIPTLLAAADAALPAGVGIQIDVSPGSYDWDGSGLTDRNVSLTGVSVDRFTPGNGDTSLNLNFAVLLPTSPVTVQLSRIRVFSDTEGSGLSVAGGSRLVLLECSSEALGVDLDTTIGDLTAAQLVILQSNISGVVAIRGDGTNDDTQVSIENSYFMSIGGASTSSAFSATAGSMVVRIVDSNTIFGDQETSGAPVMGGANVAISYIGNNSLTLSSDVADIFGGSSCSASGGVTNISVGTGSNTQSTPFSGSFALTNIPTGAVRPLLNIPGVSRDSNASDSSSNNQFPWLMRIATGAGNVWRGPANSLFLAVQSSGTGKGGSGVALMVVRTGSGDPIDYDVVYLEPGYLYRIKGTVSCDSLANGPGAWDIDDIYSTIADDFTPAMPGVSNVLVPPGFLVTLLGAGDGFQIQVDSNTDDASWSAYLQITRIEV